MSERDHDVEKKFDSGVQELWRQEFPPSCFGIHTCHKKMGVLIKKGTEKRGGIRFRRIGQFKTGLQLEPFLNPYCVVWGAVQPVPSGHTLQAGQKAWSYSFPLAESHCMYDRRLSISVSCAHRCIINTMNHIKILLNRLSSKEFMVLCKIDRTTCVKKWKKKRLSHLWTLTKCCFTGLNGISRVGGLLNSGLHFFSHKLDIAVRKESIVLKCFNNLLQL